METPNGAKIAIEEEYKRQVKRNREKRFDIPMTQANQWRDGAKWGYSLSQKDIEELKAQNTKINDAYNEIYRQANQWKNHSDNQKSEIEELREENRKLKEELKEAIDNCNKLGGMVSEAYSEMAKRNKNVTPHE